MLYTNRFLLFSVYVYKYLICIHRQDTIHSGWKSKLGILFIRLSKFRRLNVRQVGINVALSQQSFLSFRAFKEKEICSLSCRSVSSFRIKLHKSSSNWTKPSVSYSILRFTKNRPVDSKLSFWNEISRLKLLAVSCLWMWRILLSWRSWKHNIFAFNPL